MTGSGRQVDLPAEILDVIDAVLSAARLDFVDGRAEVEEELVAHFEDGLTAGGTVAGLIEKFGDPTVAGRKIACTRPRASARNRGEQGRWWMSPAEWLGEARQSVKRLGRAPAFAVVVVLTLGLGIGANTAIFTVLDAVVLRDLPYPDADRLVRVFEAREDDPLGGEYLRAPLVGEYRKWDEVFANVSSLYTYRDMGADLTEGDTPERVQVLWVSAGYFETLGIAPERGRTFTDDESFGPGEATSRTVPISYSAVISHGLWARRFGASDDVLGRSVALDGTAYEIVGVMPRGFRNPFGVNSDVWLPHDLRMGGSNSYNNWFLSAVARLGEGVSLEQAQERIGTFAGAFGEEQPEAAGSFPRLIPLQQDVVGSTRATMLWILAGAAGLVLLTACLNVANLIFARGLGRDRDLALRAALGAGRGRMIAGILTENGILALAGGIMGLAFGWIGVVSLLRFAPGIVPAVTEVQVGTTVFLFATAVTMGSLLLFGLAPALRMSRATPSDVLRSGDRASTVGKVARRLRDGLVVLQVGAALTLVAGAALFSRSFNELVNVPLGLEPEGVLTFEVHLPESRYPNGAGRQALHERLEDRVASLSNVSSVGATSWLPINGRYHSWSFYWDPEHPDGSNDEAWHGTDVRVFAGDYLGTMGIDVVRGADPTDVDYETEPMAWIDQTVADEVFAETDPLGQQIFLGDAVRRVMGVVAATPYDTRGQSARTAYIPHAQFADDRNWALMQTVRAQGNLGDLAAQIREALKGIDAELVLFQPRPFEDRLREAREQDRFAALLMGAFAALALLLALVGTYGVLAGSVAARTREIGIRMALGADAQTVRNMVLRYAAALTLPGMALGLAGAWVGSRWIGALLFEVDVADPVAAVGTIAIFLVVGLVSGWLPARRATRVDTVQTLTAE